MRGKLMILLPLLGLMIGSLTARTTPYSVPTTEVRHQLHLTPNELLQHPCDAVEPGRTVRALGMSYAHNTSCIHQYRMLIESQKQYKAKIEELYGERSNANK